MPLDKKYYINTGKDGILEAETNEDHVRKLVAGLRDASKIVIHLHGGLISNSAALEKAERLVPAYEAAGARPVFMVWESDFFAAIRHNLHEIDKEKIFGFLVKRVLKYAVGKLTDVGGSKSTGQLQLPRDLEVGIELSKRNANQVPYADLRPQNLDELTDAERKRFEDSLATDTEFQLEVQAIVDSARPEQIDTNSKGIVVRRQKSTATLMSPEVLDELVADASAKEGKGIFSTAKLIFKAGEILWRVIQRFRTGRDHGLYTTVVEEVLREFYLANVGAAVWGFMKQDTADTFANFGRQPARGGWLLVQELGKLLKEGHRPEISIVAHSAGAIYAAHLLEHLAWARDDDGHPLPKDFRLENLIFMAPACSFAVFDRALVGHRKSPLFDHFRMFSLKDELEAGYWEIPAVYPRSLLYLVAGVVEQEQGKSAQDLPLVGMQRYHTDIETYQQPEVIRVRELFAAAQQRGEVWSEEDARGSGLASDAIKHGGFDSTDQRSKTIQSIQHILQSGW